MKNILLPFIALFCAFQMNAQVAKSQWTHPVDGKFILPELPYSKDALEPVISAETIELHYGKHYSGYISNLNKLIAGKDFQKMTLQEIVKKSEGGIFNNAGQAFNHELYFGQFQPRQTDNHPVGKLQKAIERQYGSFEQFQKKFSEVAGSLFGSGWVFLSSDEKGQLHITKSANGSNSIVEGLRPLLAVDLWEHAYYLDYHNLRAKHVDALWSIINWKVVDGRYTAK